MQGFARKRRMEDFTVAARAAADKEATEESVDEESPDKPANGGGGGSGSDDSDADVPEKAVQASCRSLQARARTLRTARAMQSDDVHGEATALISTGAVYHRVRELTVLPVERPLMPGARGRCPSCRALVSHAARCRLVLPH